MCSPPQQGHQLPPGTDLTRETVLAGTVVVAGEPAAGAYVRLLDDTGEFTAEVVSSASGDFRFFARPGDWTVRALHRSGTGETTVSADAPGLHEIEVALARP